MNVIVCFVILIYLCSGNEAGHWSESHKSHHKKHHGEDSKEILIPIDNTVRNQKFTCDSKQQHDHQWYHYHVYSNGKREEPISIPEQRKVKTTTLKIRFESFDNNTEIHCLINNYVETIHWPDNFLKKHDTRSSSYRIIRIGISENLKDSEEPVVLKYNETQKASFECQEYIEKQNLVVGEINTTSNMLITYNRTYLDTLFNKSENGTVLCCIYYEVIKEPTDSWITRRVAKKTLLIYDDADDDDVADRQNSLEEKDLDSSSNSADDDRSPNANSGKQDATDKPDTDTVKQDSDKGKADTDTPKQDSDTSKQNTDTAKQDSDTGKQNADAGQQNADSSKQDADTGNQTAIIYIVSAVAVVFIFLVVCIIYLKRCRKKPKVELENNVLYADLEFLGRNESESLPKVKPEEESPYAQIIGELRPQ